MKKRMAALALLLGFVATAGTAGMCYADSAEVLPQGVRRINLKTNVWLPIEELYNPDGDREPLASNFNAALNSDVFPDLSVLETGFGMPAGSALLGQSVVDFTYHLTDVILDCQYGVTDKLSVGISIPYWFQNNTVRVNIDTSTATVGLNPAYGTAGDPYGTPLIPIEAGGLRDDTLMTEFVQQSLESMGFKRLATWSDGGIADIEAGFRYQYLKNADWRLAFTGGVNLPTGKADDQDNLADLSFGSGAYSLFLHLNQDYVGIKNLTLNATLRYKLVLPDKEKLFVPVDVNQPLMGGVEEVDRNLGDGMELEFSGGYEVIPGLSLSLLYRYEYKMRDEVSGDLGLNYESLEDETEGRGHVAIVGVAYSTLPLFMEKKFPIPIDVSLLYRNRFAGKNNYLASDYITLALSVAF